MNVSFTFGTLTPATAQVTRVVNKSGAVPTKFKAWWKRIGSGQKGNYILNAQRAVRADSARELFRLIRKSMRGVNGVDIYHAAVNIKIGRVTLKGLPSTRFRSPWIAEELTAYEARVQQARETYIADIIANMVEMWEEAEEEKARSEAVDEGMCPDCDERLDWNDTCPTCEVNYTSLV